MTASASRSPVYLDASALRAVMSFEQAVDALEAAFAGELAEAPQRTVVEYEGGQLLSMPAAGRLGSGVKLVTVQPANPARGLPLIHGVYVLFAPGTLAPAGFLDGAELTRIRAPAVSGVATRLLAREDARHLVVFGAGIQAAAHVEVMRVVRPIERVTIVDPDRDAAERLVATLAAEGVDARIGSAEAVADADIVCACTTSPTPLFDGALLAAGAHVNAMGSYQPHTRELDTLTIHRATVVVETREAAMSEAGDILIPIREGAIDPAHVAGELADVARGEIRRRDAGDVTVFKSVGVAFEDLVVAAAALERHERS
jgi:ornithine cyclodeaminase